MAFPLLIERANKHYFISKYIDLYAFFLVGTQCVGLSAIFQYLDASWNSTIFFSAYFFTAAGIGLLLGRIVKNVSQKT